jgi:hypothetical protein
MAFGELLWKDAPPSLGSAQDAISPICALKLNRRVLPYFRGTGRAGRNAGAFLWGMALISRHTEQAARLLKNGAIPRRIDRTKGGLNSKLQAGWDVQGKPVLMLLSEGVVIQI